MIREDSTPDRQLIAQEHGDGEDYTISGDWEEVSISSLDRTSEAAGDVLRRVQSESDGTKAVC